MQVFIGNPKPMEIVFDSYGHQYFVIMGGQTTTRLFYPDDISIEDATLATIDAMKYHMQERSIPDWIESDNKVLHRTLCKYYGIKATVKRPGGYGMMQEEGKS